MIARLFWKAVHRLLPCRLIHIACDLCRTSGYCPKCPQLDFEDALTTAPPTTSTSGQTYQITWEYRR